MLVYLISSPRGQVAFQSCKSTNDDFSSFSRDQVSEQVGLQIPHLRKNHRKVKTIKTTWYGTKFMHASSLTLTWFILGFNAWIGSLGC